MSNILYRKKKFCECVPGDKLYLIDPNDQKIKETIVVKSGVHPKSLNKKVWAIEFNMVFRINFSEGGKKIANQTGTRITDHVLVEADSYIALLVSKIPTVLSTDKNVLKKWMEKGRNRLMRKRG